MVNAQRHFLGKFQRAALTKLRTAAKSGSRPQGGVGRGPNRSRKGTGPRVPGPDGFSLESAPEHPRTRASKHPRTRTSTHPSMQKPVLTFPPKREVSTGAHETREPGDPGTQGPRKNQGTRIPKAPGPQIYLRFFSSSVACGATLNRSPTTPKSAISKMEASSSLFTATMVLEVCIPALC